YIDSLARIQSRTEPSRLGGSIERLQANAQKLSEQMAWLRSVKVFSETVLEGSPLGLMIWNPAGELVRGNTHAQRLLPSMGVQPQFIDFVRAIGRSPDEGADKKDFRALLIKGKDWQATTTESEKELVINMSAVGKHIAHRLICASIIDVSAIRTAERARAEMVDYLSHDLRSPLISALYLLDDDSGTEYDDKERAIRIEQNIQRSLVMMDDLLHVARADGLDEQKFSEVLFNAVVDNALDQLLPQARSRKIQVDIDTTEKDLWMNGDAASLERAVVNVIGNAIKYSQEGGRVCVCLSGVAGEALLQITDQGVGIDPAMMKDLFTRFRRDATTSDKFKGIGLGLA
ncbi:MAG: HAMP domain-containing histidine kinase, partial [Methylococcales bacterium]|nr:HAMP domain-containing histidine kinase [Methylococcales bacterium]